MYVAVLTEIARLRFGLLWCAVILLAASAIAAEPSAKATLPPAADRAVVFAKDVVPIFNGSCAKCHSGREPKGGLNLETRKQLLAGGESGAVVIEGKSAESRLIKLVSGLEPDTIMPAQGPRLTKEQIGILRAWIDQGLPWDEGFRFRGVQQAALEPRRVELPAAESASGLTNPIDRLLAPYFKQQGFTPGPVVSDAVFARRVSLDLVGLLPTPERLAEFEKDTRPDKRERLVRELLADQRAYADHWLTFWNDALRNAYRGTGFIDGGRKQITDWLYRSLYENKPYDRFVHELISPTPESDGFINGIIWRGVVNASQRKEMQAAQNVSQVFMGTNLKCASCHDSFINHWKLTDSYSLAAVFADGSLEIHRCDKPTGGLATAGFIYPQLGAIDPKAPRAQRMKQLADIMTSPNNGRLSRTIVNRLWAWQMGRGIIEPLDDLDQPAWNQDLLDWLAADLVEHKYDLKHTLELICTSRAYQLAAVGAPRPDATGYAFRGPIVKRMTAEQFVDAVSAVTGVWSLAPVAKPKEAAPPAVDHKFIKFDSGIMKSGAKEVDIDLAGAKVLRLVVADADDGAGFDWADWGQPRFEGEQGSQKLTGLKWLSASTGYGKVEVDKNCVGKPLRIDGKEVPFGLGTHAHSVIVYDVPAGATRFKATVGPDTGSVEQKDTKVSIRFLVLTGEEPSAGGVRTSLANDDALTRALGRPNREQVITRRDTLATTLQALELTNGDTLDSVLKRGAKNWSTRQGTSPDELVAQIYRKALGRLPSEAERRAARELVGESLSAEGLEDLLWVVTMLPEFQLIQ